LSKSLHNIPKLSLAARVQLVKGGHETRAGHFRTGAPRLYEVISELSFRYLKLGTLMELDMELEQIDPLGIRTRVMKRHQEDHHGQ